MVKNFCFDPTWIPRVIIKKLAPLTYLVKVQGELKWRCHIDLIESLGNNTIKPNTNENTDPDQESTNSRMNIN